MGPVLIVEDDADIAQTVSEILTSEGYETVLAANGRDAMDALSRMLRPCLVLLDMMMPVMSGWEVLKALQADVSLAAIPVVITSACSEMKTGEPPELIKKPYDLDRLLGVVERFCSSSSREGSCEAPSCRRKHAASSRTALPRAARPRARARKRAAIEQRASQG